MIVIALVLLLIILSMNKRNKVLKKNFADYKVRKHVYNEHIIEKDEDDEEEKKNSKLDIRLWKKILKIILMQ